MKRLALLLALCLTACAQSRAEERALEHALGHGYVAPVADCDAERRDLPGYLLCNVEETDPAEEPRGFQVACPSGLRDGACLEPPPSGTFGLAAGGS